MQTDIRVVLVNLISEDYLARYQAPLAVNVLAAYFRSVCPDIMISTIDMQDVFEEQGNDKGTIGEIFAETVKSVVAEIVSACSAGRIIVGLSVKWSTQEIAGQIINLVRQGASNSQPLFVIGNIGSTHGYRELLVQDDFADIVAVVGEGEESLAEIARIASRTSGDFRDILNYKDVVNTAIFYNKAIRVSELRRMDLTSYPAMVDISPSDIYDREWDVYAVETSRGCPWGNCTFCSVKKQFGASNQYDNHGFDWRWRAFPVAKVLGDIYSFARQGVRRFDIKDSEFFGPVRTAEEFFETMNRVNELANGLIALNEELRSAENLIQNSTVSITHVSARVDTIYSANPLEKKKNIVRRNAYALLKAAGLRRVYLGIESGSPSQLKRYRKGVSVEENKQAIKILRELGLEIEVGFIFFDYLSTLEELRQNILFIEETHIHETDSRILGSLRIQKGSPYEAIAEKLGILGGEDSGQLSYEAAFVNKEVAEIEALFSEWERATRKLAKIIPSHLRIENYKMDFAFVKDIIACFEADRKDWLYTAIEEHSATRSNFLKKIKQAFDSGLFGRRVSKLFLEYLDHANAQNAILAKEVAHARYDGGI
ncbi:hypothetical protein COV49_03480 [Candidatus Falkowbacteria bacterium CG11_big_fil_rev_8_21_14_0_20_39_10]|uniref:Radical SAM core domain-containing protein n=1 Tax=Candidatus Falkowbacteria bacterium CG11_big_fil_rev_8_21_14_0_20_39_10 TaxID=1974570 RepID=A0A2M6K8H2_9BACT|nr:MAG: hypothetical protein COV49_03480 [Candidatus Falkowbacteria bacterium CG11_big_fil_rev_8_21_14_0_20_39_10]